MTSFENQIREILSIVPAIKECNVSVHYGVLVISDINNIKKLNVVYIKSSSHEPLYSSFLGQTEEEFQTHVLQADIKVIDVYEMETYMSAIEYKDWKNIKFEYKRESK